ncbi:hypothetical protein FAZ69_24760 [Trinickia terrae]|uniref:Uncharacterized protein n=1 Tax=Trinickia terrae TaxID=2571161 RepID=A0A4V5PHC9_9BURK|nr:hypothetical protein [Trinickia terrae]TKC82920.1 hypothetical protein FAZ69_24760 [Trinickia terrae]
MINHSRSFGREVQTLLPLDSVRLTTIEQTMRELLNAHDRDRLARQPRRCARAEAGAGGERRAVVKRRRHSRVGSDFDAARDLSCGVSHDVISVEIRRASVASFAQTFA